MTGAPKDAGAFMIVYKHWLEPLDYNAAYAAIFQRILWRSDFHGGSWTASHATIAEETGFPLRTVRRATQHLREIGWLTSERASTWDPTTCWTPVLDEVFQIPDSKDSREGQSGHHEVADVDTSQVADSDITQVANVATTQVADSAITSFQTTKTSPDNSKNPAAPGAVQSGPSTSPVATVSEEDARLMEGAALLRERMRSWSDLPTSREV